MYEPRQYADRNGNILNYRLLKPADFDPAERYPLVIFLHGAGERGDDNSAQLKHGAADFCRTSIREAYPCYVLAPQCPEGKRWAEVDWSQTEVAFPEAPSTPLQLTFEVVDTMLAQAAIDQRRVYITGLSMGGYGTWDAVARRPNFFAAAIPICGGGDPKTAQEIVELPIWCFHGDQDGAVPVQNSRNMIEALRSAGGEPKYTEYVGVGHDSWTQTYANDDIYRWMFAQRRQTN